MHADLLIVPHFVFGGGVGWGSNVHVDVHTLLTSHDCYVSCCAWLETMPTKVHWPARCVLGTKISVRVHDPKKNMKKLIHAFRTTKINISYWCLAGNEGMIHNH